MYICLCCFVFGIINKAKCAAMAEMSSPDKCPNCNSETMKITGFMRENALCEYCGKRFRKMNEKWEELGFAGGYPKDTKEREVEKIDRNTQRIKALNIQNEEEKVKVQRAREAAAEAAQRKAEEEAKESARRDAEERKTEDKAAKRRRQKEMREAEAAEAARKKAEAARREAEAAEAARREAEAAEAKAKDEAEAEAAEAKAKDEAEAAEAKAKDEPTRRDAEAPLMVHWDGLDIPRQPDESPGTSVRSLKSELTTEGMKATLHDSTVARWAKAKAEALRTYAEAKANREAARRKAEAKANDEAARMKAKKELLRASKKENKRMHNARWLRSLDDPAQPTVAPESSVHRYIAPGREAEAAEAEATEVARGGAAGPKMKKTDNKLREYQRTRNLMLRYAIEKKKGGPISYDVKTFEKSRIAKIKDVLHDYKEEIQYCITFLAAIPTEHLEGVQSMRTQLLDQLTDLERVQNMRTQLLDQLSESNKSNEIPKYLNGINEMPKWLKDLKEMKYVHAVHANEDIGDSGQNQGVELQTQESANSSLCMALRIRECQLAKSIKKATKFIKRNTRPVESSIYTDFREEINTQMEGELSGRYVIKPPMETTTNSSESTQDEKAPTTLDLFLQWNNLQFLSGMPKMKRNTDTGEFLTYDDWIDFTKSNIKENLILKGQDAPIYVDRFTGFPTRRGKEAENLERKKEEYKEMYGLIKSAQEKQNDEISAALAQDSNNNAGTNQHETPAPPAQTPPARPSTPARSNSPTHAGFAVSPQQEEPSGRHWHNLHIPTPTTVAPGMWDRSHPSMQPGHELLRTQPGMPNILHPSMYAQHPQFGAPPREPLWRQVPNTHPASMNRQQQQFRAEDMQPGRVPQWRPQAM